MCSAASRHEVLKKLCGELATCRTCEAGRRGKSHVLIVLLMVDTKRWMRGYVYMYRSCFHFLLTPETNNHLTFQARLAQWQSFGPMSQKSRVQTPHWAWSSLQKQSCKIFTPRQSWYFFLYSNIVYIYIYISIVTSHPLSFLEFFWITIYLSVLYTLLIDPSLSLERKTKTKTKETKVIS